MSTIDKIIKLLNEKKLTQKALTDYLGIDKSVFPQWKKGTNRSYKKYIEEIADFLDTSPSELMDWEPKAYNINLLCHIPNKAKFKEAINEVTLKIISENTYYIPVYESVSAGFGAYANDYVIDYTPLYIESPEDAQNTIVIVVSGDSMYPKIEDGDKIQVLRQDWAESGDIAVVLIDGEEAVVKKYVCDMEHETVTLQSINPEYAPRVFANKDIERLRVLGVVENIIKPVKRA